GDEVEVAVRGPRIITGVNPLVAGKCAAVKQIERFALGHVFVGIEDLDFRDESSALKGERSTGTHAATAADNGYFHNEMVRYAGWQLALFPLTLTLSLREREPRHQMSGCKAVGSGFFAAERMVHPLPKGEGWGEGKETAAVGIEDALTWPAADARRSIWL